MKLLPSTQRFSTKGIDLTNGYQKMLALGLLGGVGFGLYKALPFLITFITNIWTALAIGLPLVFLVSFIMFNYQSIWGMFKSLSWKATKWLISKDKFGHMNIYVDWMGKQIEAIKESVQDIAAIQKSMADEVVKSQNEIGVLIAMTDKNPDDSLTFEKIGLLKESIEAYIPDIEASKKHINDMGDLVNFMSKDKQALEFSLETLAKRFELATKLNNAVNRANNYLNRDSVQYKNFLEAKKQIGDKVNKYIASYEMFQRNFTPILENAKIRKEVKDDSIRKYINDFKASRGNLFLNENSKVEDATIVSETKEGEEFIPKYNSTPHAEKVEVKKPTQNNNLDDILNYNPY